MQIANAQAMKAMDMYAIQTMGISSLLLMENAARAVVREVMALLKHPQGSVTVFCGSGNNGGDGVAAARFLLENGCQVRCFLTGERRKMTPDTAEMHRRLLEIGGELEDFSRQSVQDALEQSDILVDAMFGTGLHSDLRGNSLLAVQMINASGLPVVACDIASGIHTDTGKVLGAAVQAHTTVTFSMVKPGQLLTPGATYTGRLVVADIGIPLEAQASQPTLGTCITEAFVTKHIPKRQRDTHKGDYGKVLLVCGSTGLTGAAVMAAQAALRTGSGLVSLGVPEAVYPIVAVKAPAEAMVFPLPCDANGRLSRAACPEILHRLRAADACLLGPGLGRSGELQWLLSAILQEANLPMVLDADALNGLSENLQSIRDAQCPLILTPHDGEFVRLGGDLQAERIQATMALCQNLGAIVVRKGHRTIVSDGKQIHINQNGNPGMATGGSGDVLSGIILSLLGQGLAPMDAAACGVWLHAAAGDACAASIGEYGMLPTDLIAALPSFLP